MIGVGGVQDYARNLAEGVRSPAAFHIDPHAMLAGWLPNPWLGRAAEALAGAVALLTAWRWRGTGAATPIAVGTLGSLLASPFLHTQDLMVLFVALGAYVAAQRVRPLNWFAYLSLFTPLLTPLPLVFEVAWLGVLLARRPSPAAELAGSSPGALAERHDRVRLRPDVLGVRADDPV